MRKLARKNINVILSLKDRFSKPTEKAAKTTKQLERQLKQATNTVKKFGNSLNDMAKGATRAAATMATAFAGGALTVGLKEAMDLEGYRIALNTAMKDTKKAGETMEYAINLANKTPFEGGELAEGAAMLESFGMNAQKWLPLIGDLAAGKNKPFMQAVEALVDAQTGELERLKEFGITKDMAAAKALKMFNKEVVNNKGQITDMAKFNEAIMAIMVEDTNGAMVAMSETLSGKWSTVTGITKNSLARMAGMMNDGTVKAGSLLEILKEKIDLVASRLEQWQSDGTIEDISDKMGEMFTNAFDKANKAIVWVKDNMSGLIRTGKALVVTFVAFNVINGVAALMSSLTIIVKGLRAAFLLLNFSMLANPFVLVTLGMVAVAGAIAGVLSGIIYLNQKFNIVGSTIDWVKGKFEAFTTFLSNFKVPQWISDLANKAKSIATNMGAALSGGNVSQNGHATGTPYFSGGLTRINEGGRGEVVNLPNGTQIIPHDVASRQGKGTNVSVNLTIQGNVIGNKQFMEQVGSYVGSKVMTALGNI